jgi:hypothetical protein
MSSKDFQLGGRPRALLGLSARRVLGPRGHVIIVLESFAYCQSVSFIVSSLVCLVLVPSYCINNAPKFERLSTSTHVTHQCINAERLANGTPPKSCNTTASNCHRVIIHLVNNQRAPDMTNAMLFRLSFMHQHTLIAIITANVLWGVSIIELSSDSHALVCGR